MSIKNQLRAAILSGGAEGSGENLSTAVYIPTTSSYVAPANGAVYLQGATKASGGMSLGLTKNGIGSVVTATAESTWINIVTIPVRKGDSVYFGMSNIGNAIACFVKLVGGGLKALWHSSFGGLCHA